MATRTGKIARLPDAIRKEINQRLLDGQTSPKILEWVNAQAAAIQLWEADFEGVPASAENLSQWRKGGYEDWRRRNEKSEHLKTLSEFALNAAKSGGGLADGAAAIVAGHFVEALETIGNVLVTGGSDDAEKSPLEGLAVVASAVGSLQKGAAARDRINLDREKVKLKRDAQKLDREKFETQTVTKFLEWARTPEAAAILDSGKPREVVMADLRQLLFGTQPQTPAAS